VSSGSHRFATARASIVRWIPWGGRIARSYRWRGFAITRIRAAVPSHGLTLYYREPPPRTGWLKVARIHIVRSRRLVKRTEFA
jgi:hypothetical protein